MKKIPSSEITPEHLYLSRRKFLKELGIASATAAILAACKPQNNKQNATPTAGTGSVTNSESLEIVSSERPDLDPSVDPLTSFDDVTQYNNFYEFTTSKSGVASQAAGFKTSPWNVSVSGLVNNPKTYTLEVLRSKFPMEERIYRMRCVEAWSMVIPWVGFPLASILDEVQPTSDAKYVKFTTLYDPEQMPGQNNSYPWPYVEGLRVDEAMHDLTILATGLYGKYLLPQDGAPVRLVVPWKYGFKSIKSIVKIELVSEMPVSFWMSLAPNEYGFYANVNPNVPHPRWSQSTEKRIGEGGRRDTLLFNGYEDEVANLYEGMDLTKWY